MATVRNRPAYAVFALLSLAAAPAFTSAAHGAERGIPIRFHLAKPGNVTLVIEDADGKRVRNLVSDTPFPAGDNVAWWDGTDDLARDTEAARHGLYQIPARFVAPGRYRVRGITHRPVHLRYEFAVYTNGRPAWETEDGRGGWLANHTPPSAVLFVPAVDAAKSPAAPCEGGVILVGSYVSEGGSGLAWLDLQGRKRYGQMWVGGVWTGATHLARDDGPRRVRGVYAYAGAAWEGGGFDGPKPELRLAELLTAGARAAAPRDSRFGKGWDRPLLAPNSPYPGILPQDAKPGQQAEQDFRYTFPDNAHTGLSGLAVHNALLVASLPKMNQLLWVDAARRRIMGTSSVPDPRGVAYDADGRLLVLSGRRLLRYTLGEDPTRLPEPTVVVGHGLEDPQGIAVAGGRIYVSDWGRSQQVKVFLRNGRRVATFGHAGEPKPGPYDPLHMNHPKGLTIDGRGKLWVAEEDTQPKRVSVWNPDGTLWRAFYGPSEYGGGGTLDPRDKTRFYYHGMEFRLDWASGASGLVSVYFRPTTGGMPLPDGYGASGTPDTPLYAHGRQYMTNCYNSNPTNGSSISMLWLLEKGKARPVAALGRAADWSLLTSDAFRSRWPAGVDLKGDRKGWPALFVWSDLNGDGQVQPKEVQMMKGTTGGVTVMPDLAFLESRVDDRTMRFAPVRFTAAGVPVYDLERGQVLLTGAQPPTSSGGDQALLTPDGRLVLTVAPKPFAPEGIGGRTWSYPSLWPGLHASHESAAPDRRGELIGTTRLLGGFVATKGGNAGPLFAINGNMGPIYLFTADGLFVAQLFQDVRQGRSWTMPEAKRGMLLDDVSPHDENFWPSIAQTSDGHIYLVDGGRTSLVRVDGLETIRRLPSTWVTVSPADLRAAREWQIQEEAKRQQAGPREELRVAMRGTAPVVDGKLDDWNGAQWATIDDRGTRAWFDSNSKPYDVKAAVAVANGHLFAAFQTGDPQLLRNAGDAIAPFKTGGALDLMLATDPSADPARLGPVPGDERLLITLVEGKTKAVLYRAVVPGAQHPVPFSSPWRTVTMDQVQDVSDQVRLASAEGNYEVSVPLAVLGLNPSPGLQVRGDVGILRGNGFQTLQRVYWHNKATAITSDVPSEAELTPQLWGTWRFVPGS